MKTMSGSERFEIASRMTTAVRERHPGTPAKDWRDRLQGDYPGLFETNLAVGAGWSWILRALAENLVEAGLAHDTRFDQIKEKFGTLRAYCSTVGNGYEIVDSYELLSSQTCEDCGEPGVLRSGSWFATLCDVHAAGRKPVRCT